MALKWRIYYDDGTIYSNTDGSPFVAPPNGVQVVKQEDPSEKTGFRVFHSRDAYYWKEDRWFSCDEPGMWDYLLMYRGPKAILFGRWMTRSEDFWATFNKARTDPLD